MKKSVTINDKNMINSILENSEYGTLALCVDNKPYSLPINFVSINDEIYFHGAKKGRKMDLLKENTFASFSVVEALSLIPSYFSSEDKSACPATQLFKSLIIDGKIEIVENYDQKAAALEALMQKLQKEGKYIPLNHEMYKKAINATALFKLIPDSISGKFKLGQNLTQKRKERVLEHLKQRGSKQDLETIELILQV